jgi:hypothetical protein
MTIRADVFGSETFMRVGVTFWQQNWAVDDDEGGFFTRFCLFPSRRQALGYILPDELFYKIEPFEYQLHRSHWGL